jgi:hypothetical protein
VQVHRNPEAGFVDVEVPAEPGAEECDHRCIRVGELHNAVGLRPLAAAEGDAGDEEGVGGEDPDALGAGVNGTSRTQIETDDFATPSRRAMASSVSPEARSARASSCAWSLPR